MDPESTVAAAGYTGCMRVGAMGGRVVPSESDTKLDALVNGLHSALDEYGRATEFRLFRPHVTLARNVTATRADMTHTLVSWLVREFCLVHSVPNSRGNQYQPVKFWPLA